MPDREENAPSGSRPWFTRFMEHLPGLAWVKDRDGRYVYVNDAAVLAFGRSREELYGRTDGELFPPETAAQFRANDAIAISGRGGIQTVEALRHPNGEIHHSIVSKFPIPDADGARSLVGGMAIDITARVRMEQALQDMHAQLREAERRKDEFIATLAHELRSPLAAISTTMEWLDPDRLGAAELKVGHDVIRRQARILTRLIGDLLDVSRISRGMLTLRRERVRLSSVVRNAVEASRPLLNASGHDLVLMLPPEDLHVDGDPIRLTQVLSNLLNNAATYTPDLGRITLHLREEDGHAVLRLQDTGIGIAREMLSRIFEPFMRAESPQRGSPPGLGIGLALARQLVELHGGTIAAESEGAGKGSRFTVRLPLAAAAETGPVAEPSPDVPEAARRRVLIVDDNKDAARMLSLVLDRLGHQTRTAHDGVEALGAVESFRPDAALLDLGLPRLDGYELARALRALPGGDTLLLVAVTGWGQDSDRARSQAAGFDHHLVKPVDLETLQRVLGTRVAAPAGATNSEL